MAVKSVLKPSKEGKRIGGKALRAESLTQEEIQKYKNQGYAHWFMETGTPEKEPETKTVSPKLPEKDKEPDKVVPPPRQNLGGE